MNSLLLLFFAGDRESLPRCCCRWRRQRCALSFIYRGSKARKGAELPGAPPGLSEGKPRRQCGKGRNQGPHQQVATVGRAKGETGEKSRERGKEEARCPLVPFSKRRLAVPLSSAEGRGRPPELEAAGGGWAEAPSFPARGDSSVGAGGELGPGLAVLPARLGSDFFRSERCPCEARRGCRCQEKQDGGGCHPASQEPPASSWGSLLPASCGRGS